MKANDTQVDGNHWVDRPIQVWDFIHANSLDYFQGNIIKYVVRHADKNKLKDLLKARHYLQKLIEVKYPEYSESDVLKDEIACHLT